MDRLRIGVPKLDKALRGGIPRGSLILILGPPGSGKTILGLQFLFEGLLYDKSSILIDTGDLVPGMKETAIDFSWDPTHLERMERLDCFSWRAGGTSSFTYSANPSDLSSLSIAVTKMIEDKRIALVSNARLVFDSYSDIILGGSDFMKFLPIFRGKLSKAGVTALLMVESGMHDDKTVAAIEHLSDGTITLKADETGRFIMVRRMLATPVELKWTPFSIRQGIDVVAEMFLG